MYRTVLVLVFLLSNSLVYSQNQVEGISGIWRIQGENGAGARIQFTTTSTGFEGRYLTNKPAAAYELTGKIINSRRNRLLIMERNEYGNTDPYYVIFIGARMMKRDEEQQRLDTGSN